ncbi:glycosyltransferase [Paenibacillus vandeheii]
MKMDPKITSVLTVKTLDEKNDNLLESLIHQSIGLNNIEIILIILNQIEDETILQEYESKYTNLKIINQVDGDLNAAKNKSISISNGEYLSYIEETDVLSLNAYERLYNSSEEGQVDIISGKVFDITNSLENRFIISKIFNIDREEEDVDLTIDRAYWDLMRFPETGFRIYRKEFLLGNNITFSDIINHSNFYFNIVSYLSASHIKIINENVIRMNVDDSYTSNNASREDFIDSYKIINKLLEYVKNQNQYSYIINKIILDTFLPEKGQLENFLNKKCIDIYNLNEKEFLLIKSTLLQILSSVSKETLSTLSDKNKEMYVEFLRNESGISSSNMSYFVYGEYEKENPLVSVIVPVFQVEDYILTCLQSLSCQTVQNIEVILVNDATNDDSAVIASDFAESHDNFHIYHNEKNGGQGDARNLGLKYAKGKYILFLDSDDLLPPRACELLLNKALAADSDIVIGKSTVKKTDGSEEDVEYLKHWFKETLFVNYREEEKIAIGFPIVTAKLFKRSLISENDVKFPLIKGEDVPFAVETFYYADNIHLIYDTVYWRRQRANSTMQTYNANIVVDRLKGMGLIDTFCKKNDLNVVRSHNIWQLNTINNIFLNINDVREKLLAYECIIKYLKSINSRRLRSIIGRVYKMGYRQVMNLKIEDYERHLVNILSKRKPINISLVPEHIISIIIPVYNVEKYIEESISSIVNQTIGLDKIEVILVNDMSTDRSGEIIDRYAKKYSNFKVIHLNENSGAAGKPRNVGIENATGDYLMFLDPDDSFTKNACEVLYQNIIEFNADISLGFYTSIYENGNKTKPNIFNQIPKSPFYLKDIEDFKNLYRFPPAVWSKMFKTKFIIENNIKFPEKIVAQDLVFSVHSYLKARGIVYTNTSICNYKVRNGEEKSISNNCNLNYFSYISKAQKFVYDLFLKNNRIEDYAFIIGSSLDYYLSKMIGSDLLSNTDRIQVMKELNWFFEIGKGFRLVPSNALLLPIYNRILEEQYSEAELLMRLYKELNYGTNVELKRLQFDARRETSRSNVHPIEQELQQIYNMRSWKYIQRYRDFMDTTKMGRMVSKFRNKVLK